jgi:hypothetical protein
MDQATFNYVEEYIEFIGGYRNANGTLLGIFETKSCPINLARYDVKIIDSFCQQTIDSNRAYTDKQAELAVTLIRKYARQLSNLGIKIPDTLDSFKLGIRNIDRTRSIFLKDQKIYLKFPYDTKLLSLVRSYVKDTDGQAVFNYDNKVWILAMTEPMLNWSMAMAETYNFNIDPDLKNLYNRLVQFEQQEYKIELRRNSKLEITNCPKSLEQYIEHNCGGFVEENLFKLVDLSSVLGYSLHQEIFREIKNRWPKIWPLLVDRRIKLSKTEYSMETVLEYAKMADRLPAYSYDQNKFYIMHLNEKNSLTKSDLINVNPKLLVTTSMMIGPKKQGLLANSEKVIILE